MKKVLIIGANSYIGKKFYEYIIENSISTIEASLVSASDGSWKKADFTEYDTVLHLSAIVHKKEKKDMKELYFNVNHKLAVDIARHAKDSGVRQFAFMSTAAVYGKITGCITEDTVPNPNTYYGMSKLAAEKDIMKLQDAEFKVTIIRPPMVYGEGCKGNYIKIKKAARYLFLLPDHHNKRSVVGIERLIQDIINLICNNNAGIYFPQDNEYLDTCNMVMNERKQMGKKTYLIPGDLIVFFINRINLVGKIFGDFYYSKNLKISSTLKG